MHYHLPASKGRRWVEETVFVVTDGGEQHARLTFSAIEQAIQAKIKCGDMILGDNVKHVRIASDGCSAQFKCGDAGK